MGSSRIRHAAIAALLVAGLAACDDDPEVDRDPGATASGTSIPPETSSASDPSPTGPVEPTLPAEGGKETRAGAVAFVDYYWEVVSYARTTGDVQLLQSLSYPSCAGCNGGIESIVRVYDRGGRIIGGRFDLIRGASNRTPSGAWNVSARVAVARSRTVGAGDLNQVVRPGELDFLFGLEHEDGAWRATFLDAP